jgi:hypothetical protein
LGCEEFEYEIPSTASAATFAASSAAFSATSAALATSSSASMTAFAASSYNANTSKQRSF